MLSLHNAEKRFDKRTLYENVSLELRRGERVLMIGKNGCGKTTLIKDIKNGIGKLGAGVSIGYFDQHGSNLSENKTIFEQLRDTFSQKSDTEIRSALALFLFKGDEVFKSISTLSGGEKARVALCELMLRKDNFLLLDEPTNHLDLASREVLEDALLDFDGTILAVSHDRYFINKLAHRILYFKDSTISEHRGNYDEYVEKARLAEEKSENRKTVGAGGAAYKQAKAEAAKLRKIKTQLSLTESEIEELEKQQTKIEEELCSEETATDYQRLSELTTELEEVKEKLRETMNRWEELATLL